MIVTPQSESRQIAVDSEGFVYDTETGEVLGMNGVAEVFTVDSAEKADWTLEIRSRIEGQIAGIEARLKAVTEQLKAMRREQVRRLAWWEWKFGSGLIAFARQSLTGRSKTARFGWGSVSFRQTAGTNQIIDMHSAVEWMRTWKPESIRRVETVTIKDLFAARESVIEETGEEPAFPFVVSSGPSENVTISTGIAIERGEA